MTTHPITLQPACGCCLGFGHLENLGPCPTCAPDRHAEHLAEVHAHTERLRRAASFRLEADIPRDRKEYP